MAHEFRVFQEGVFPHSCNLLWWVPEAGAETKTPNAEVGITVVDGNAESRANLVSHKLLLLLERVLFAGAVKFGPLDRADRYDRQNWLCVTENSGM